MDKKISRESALATWIVIFLLLAGIVLTGMLGFYLVGDQGQPSWDLRPAKDVPGESPYAMYQELPFPQHVRGAKGE
jgi:UPF0716 family protein affecting phage T7 exclusion